MCKLLPISTVVEIWLETVVSDNGKKPFENEIHNTE